MPLRFEHNKSTFVNTIKSEYCPRLMGAIIRDKRKDAHMNQSEASGYAGIARTHLAMIERGKKCATVDTLWKIASALNVTLSSLIQQVETTIDSLPGKDFDKEIDDVIAQMEHPNKKKDS